MARRKKRLTDAVSLFPFLSVLTCTIGTLVLGIFTLSVGYTAVDMLQGKSQENQKGQKEIDRLTHLISESESVRKALDEARQELEKLEREHNGKEKDHLISLTLTEEEKKLRERNEELENQLRSKKSEIEQQRVALEKETQNKKDPNIKIKPEGIAGEGREGGRGGDLFHTLPNVPLTPWSSTRSPAKSES